MIGFCAILLEPVRVRDRTGSRGLSGRVSTDSAVTGGDCMDSSSTMLYEPTERGGGWFRGGG